MVRQHLAQVFDGRRRRQGVEGDVVEFERTVPDHAEEPLCCGQAHPRDWAARPACGGESAYQTMKSKVWWVVGFENRCEVFADPYVSGLSESTGL
tara:strand:- start:7 stop:291 length:285 start_codon:yes stop_codon:yes gene_type:complete